MNMTMKSRCMLAGFALMTVAASATDWDVLSENATAANVFAGRLYGQLAGGAQGNFVVSPFSAHSCLTMVALGAAGDTKTQMREALQLPTEPAERLSYALRAVQARMDSLGRSGAPITLESANRIWVQASYELLPEFTRGLQETLGAAFATADFRTAAEPARGEINGWAEKKTRDRIKNLIPEGALTADTRMALVNAVYFYGAWNSPFPKEQTREEPFHVSPERTQPATMMNTTLTAISYREEDGLQVCELPYWGARMSMVVILPASGGLEALEARLAKDGVDAVVGGLFTRDVQVTLPKFKIESQFGLNDPLIALGMRDAFAADRADFSGMTGTRDLFVSAVIQKAFIEVNEKGIEVTADPRAGVSGWPPLRPQPAVFRADRPFVFVLRDRASGAALFLGRVANPAGGGVQAERTEQTKQSAPFNRGPLPGEWP